MTSVILLSLLSGVMFAVAGIAYRVGTLGNVQPNQCGVGLSIIGFLGFGLLGMQERIRKISGEFTQESILGQGTWIRILLPLTKKEETD